MGFRLRSLALSLGVLLTSAAANAGPAGSSRAAPVEPTGVILPYAPAVAAPAAPPPAPEPPPPCEKDCWLLSKLALKGQVDGTLTFELTGEVRARGEQKIPLFGPPGQVRVDEVTMDGARASVGIDGESYVLFTDRKGPFTLRGKLALGRDWMLTVPGPLLGLDAALAKGKLVEGEHLSGLTASVLHFDPMIEGQVAPSTQNKPKPVFMLRRTLRFAGEPSFSYRLFVQQPEEIGSVRLPLKLGEKVAAVEGATSFRVDGQELVAEVTGTEATLVVTGGLAAGKGSATLAVTPDERSSYEWWLVESDPEHRVAVSGEAKIVDIQQTSLSATLPNAHGYLVQRGQRVEVEARALVRGDVLAAVARQNRRFVAITGRGEVVSDESLVLDNRGLEALPFTPAGKAVYLSTDATAQRILHAEAGARDIEVPVRPGSHTLRVQSLGSARMTPLVGVLSIPTSAYPLTTSKTDIVVGLPGEIRPLAVLGGDQALFGFGRGDLVAALLGVSLACFGFRTRRTRILGSLVVAGLWLVSKEAFVVAGGGLFVAGSAFVASRFLRGVGLFAASGFAFIVALGIGRAVLAQDGSLEAATEMTVHAPEVPTAEVSASREDASGDVRTGVTPVSISLPTSERYVRTSLQLATHERPLTPRVLYVTSSLVALLHVGWLALVGMLALAHKEKLLALKARIVARLARRATAATPAASLDAPIPEGATPF